VHSEATTSDIIGARRIWTYLVEGYRFVSEVLYTNRYQLYGTAGSWFILDVVFYANGLFSGQVTASMGFGKTPKQESVAALILNVSQLSVLPLLYRPPH